MVLFYNIETIYGSEFLQVCGEQGVELTSVFRAEIGGTMPASTLVHTASKILSNYSAPADVLVENGRKIVGDMWEDQTAARVLQRIVNASIEPVTGDLTFQSQTPWHNLVCPKAEVYFLRTMQGLHNSPAADYPGCDIFMHNGQPAFIRKKLVERSSLSLVESVVSGIPYPAGSLMRVETAGRPLGEAEKGNVRVRPASDITAIRFLRLSGFAYRQPEREERAVRLSLPPEEVLANFAEPAALSEYVQKQLDA